MSIIHWKPLALFFCVTTFALILCCGWLLVDNARLSITSSFADEQTQLFHEMRDEALSSEDPSRVADYLGYVVGYYPSGTKQQHGTHLDAVVERNRKDTVAAIIRHLRELTGKDLGSDPDLWVKDFSRHPL